MKINLGSGAKLKKDFINVDIAPKTGAEVISDAYKFVKSLRTNSVNYVYSAHYLEHIEPQHYLPFLKELYRISAPNCVWELVLPFMSAGNRPEGNPLHYRSYWFGHFDSFKPTNKRDNYTEIVLKDVSPKVSTLEKIFYFHFPYLKKNREHKFILSVVK